MNNLSTIHETRTLARVIAFSGGITFIIGAIALAAKILEFMIISSIYPDYIPMAVATAILSAGFGVIYLTGNYKRQEGHLRTLVIVFLTLFTVYALMKFLEYFLDVELTLDDTVFPVQEKLGDFPVNRSSPVTGLLFFLCGLATLIKLFGKEKTSILNLVSGIGFIVLFTGFTAFIGYLFGTPFLYGGDVIPLALLTTIVFIALGSGLVAMGGPGSLLLRRFSGPSPSARILRSFLPILIIAVLADDLLDEAFSRFSFINNALISSILLVLYIPLLVFIVMKISQVIFRNADKAELARKEAQTALLKSEKQYRSLTQTATDAIIAIDPQSSIHLFNRAAERIFGYPANEVLHKSVSVLIPEEHGDMHMHGIHRHLSTEQTTVLGKTMELKGKRKGGEIFPIELSLSEVKVGDEVNFIGIIRDISERKKAESDLLRFTNELRESNATKDKFFSIIAHDLKTPFNSILGLTNVLITDSGTMSQAEINRLLKTISGSSESAFELLENLLVWANTQTGKIDFNPIQTNLSDVVEKVINLVEIQAINKGVRIVSDIQTDIVVLIDQQMIRTVFRNLLSNALKFTKKGGEVKITASTSDQFWEISVKDSGIGIPDAETENLFKIDNKYSTKGTANEKGTGLGLILCREFVEKHGGEIRVESEEGKGSTFTFTLPVGG